jgi:uracil-DNA glycosylase
MHMVDYGARSLRLVSSYHCSRYNTQTGRLTDSMLEEAIDLFATPA